MKRNIAKRDTFVGRKIFRALKGIEKKPEVKDG